MQKVNKQVSEYSFGEGWTLAAVTGENTEYHLYHEPTGHSKLVGKCEGVPENLDDEVSLIRRRFQELSDDLIYDVEVKPQHLVDTIASMWKGMKGENDFINNVAYMVLGSMIKAYNEMYENGNSWLRNDEDVQVGIIKGVHKVGEMLAMTEHRIGTVNAVANNVGNLK